MNLLESAPLKPYCPIEIIKNIGSEAIWMYRKMQELKQFSIIDLEAGE